MNIVYGKVEREEWPAENGQTRRAQLVGNNSGCFLCVSAVNVVHLFGPVRAERKHDKFHESLQNMRKIGTKR